MKFKRRSLRELADMVIGDTNLFVYRSSTYITNFFEDCDLPFVHDGSTRWRWTSQVLENVLEEPQPKAHALPPSFLTILRTLMDKGDAAEGDPDRSNALDVLNTTLKREGFEAFYGTDDNLYVRHIGTMTLSSEISPHRPFTPEELRKRQALAEYLAQCTEDDLIEQVLLPLFRQLGYHRITAAGHKDKALEYGKDVWMRFVLPTQHVLYFGLQAKRGKIDSAGRSKGSNANVAEIHSQTLMMLGHEIFDPEMSRRVLVDHALIVAGGEITKQAKNWLGQRLDASKRSQVMFMDREDILNLYTVTNLPLPSGAIVKPHAGNLDDIPF